MLASFLRLKRARLTLTEISGSVDIAKDPTQICGGGFLVAPAARRRLYPRYNQPVLTIRSRGRLPHWEADGATYFVTFRLADSFPESVRQRIEFERQDIIRTARTARRALSPTERIRLSRLFRGTIEVRLDAGAGNCWLARPEIAKIVSGNLKHFDGARYRLLAWCVMPNHVHILFRPLEDHTLESIVHAWKSYTAKASNRELRRSGEFWGREYYDHIVRDQGERERIVRYVMANPAKAGLRDWRWVECLQIWE